MKHSRFEELFLLFCTVAWSCIVIAAMLQLLSALGAARGIN